MHLVSECLESAPGVRTGHQRWADPQPPHQGVGGQAGGEEDRPKSWGVWELRLQPAVAGAKQSFNTPWQAVFGREGSWMGGPRRGEEDSRGRLQGRSRYSSFLPWGLPGPGDFVLCPIPTVGALKSVCWVLSGRRKQYPMEVIKWQMKLTVLDISP